MSKPFMEEIVWEKFHQKLLNSHCWPCIYTFKFIVPIAEEEKIKKIFEGELVETKLSSGGKYVSVTSEFRVENSEEVVDFYREASKINGVIAL